MREGEVYNEKVLYAWEQRWNWYWKDNNKTNNNEMLIGYLVYPEISQISDPFNVFLVLTKFQTWDYWED